MFIPRPNPYKDKKMTKRTLIVASAITLTLATGAGAIALRQAAAHEGHSHTHETAHEHTVTPAQLTVTTSNGWMTEAQGVALSQTSGDRGAAQPANGSTYYQESTPRSGNNTGAALNQHTGATLN